MQARSFWDAKTTQNVDLLETHNKRMQSDRSTRYASETVADAGRYVFKDKPMDIDRIKRVIW